MRIITNTAALLGPEEGRKLGIRIVPVGVSLRNRFLRDYIDIGSDEFVNLLNRKMNTASASAIPDANKDVRKGACFTARNRKSSAAEQEDFPKTSQPSVGDVLDALEESEDEMIVLTVADGLSGEYSTAMSVRNTLANKDRIHVIDSGSLGAVLQHLALKAAALRDQGLPVAEIAARVRACAQSSCSFVIPSDFTYLRRSGRISGLTQKVGNALQLLPILTQTPDRKRLSVMTVKRTWNTAVGTILARMKDQGVNENYVVSIEYADRPDLAERVRARVRDFFPNTENEILQMAPSLITHGGPGCILLQAIRK